MGYTKLGIATCIGLIDEAQHIAQYLKGDFEVYVVICKNGGLLKTGLDLEQINDDSDEVMCNPIGQALFLNQKQTDMNIICGLCVGHDILFTKYSEAPVTTIIVKDQYWVTIQQQCYTAVITAKKYWALRNKKSSFRFNRCEKEKLACGDHEVESYGIIRKKPRRPYQCHIKLLWRKRQLSPR